jgi:Putative binding domain, N-terminal
MQFCASFISGLAFLRLKKGVCMTLRRAGITFALLVASWCGLDVRAAEAQCVYSVSPTSQSALSTGQSFSISVITGAFCAWTATSAVPWITITFGASMTGLGSTNYTVAPNGTGSPRTGTLTVAGQTITVTQATSSCIYNVSPTSMAVPLTGSLIAISVSTGSSCAWTSTSSVPWIVVSSGASMTGLGSAYFTVAATTSSRTGTLTVAGQIISITQGTAQPPQSPVNLRIIRIVY